MNDARHSAADRRSARQAGTSLLFAALACLPLVGCTGAPPGSPTPAETSASPSVRTTPSAKPTAHVRLVTNAGVQTTVHYSDGEVTRQLEVPGGERALEFDAPLPWVVAATVSAGISSNVGCDLYVDGNKVAHSDGTHEPMLAVCAAAQKLPEPSEGEEAPDSVVLDSTGGKDTWHGWADARNTGTDTVAHFATRGDVLPGPVRLVVVPQRKRHTGTCTITVNHEKKATDVTTGSGDIATCATTVG